MVDYRPIFIIELKNKEEGEGLINYINSGFQTIDCPSKITFEKTGELEFRSLIGNPNIDGDFLEYLFTSVEKTKRANEVLITEMPSGQGARSYERQKGDMIPLRKVMVQPIYVSSGRTLLGRFEKNYS